MENSKKEGATLHNIGLKKREKNEGLLVIGAGTKNKVPLLIID